MGEEIKPEGNTDNTDKPEEKTLAETLYPENKDEKVEEDKDVEGESDGDSEDKTEVIKDEKEGSDDKAEEGEKSTYEDFTVPDGFEPVSDEAKGLFEKHGLSQEASQELVDFSTKIQQETIQAFKDANEAQQKEWADVVDKDLKVELSKGQGLAKRALSQEDFDALDQTGLGNHPSMVKLMAKLADFAGEDFMGKEETSVETKKKSTLADSMYGDKYDNV